MLTRCSWVDNSSDIYLDYHDQEWGIAKHDDIILFELLTLEIFQAGLAWITVLKKRAAFRQAFDGFDPTKVAGYSPDKVEQLMNNTGIIRNLAKIEATIHNAHYYQQIQKQYGSFDRYIWSFTHGQTIVNNTDNIQATSELSDQIARDLRRRHMKRLGSTTVYAYLQAIGVINDHQTQCYLHPSRQIPNTPTSNC